jgi:hypothetical protein
MKNTSTFILLIALLSLYSCGEDNRNKIAVDRVIAEEVENRVQSFRSTRMERCKEKAIDEANEIADSILIREARLSRDTISKPPKPEKPEKPEIKLLEDSTPIQPIINTDTINN